MFRFKLLCDQMGQSVRLEWLRVCVEIEAKDITRHITQVVSFGHLLLLEAGLRIFVIERNQLRVGSVGQDLGEMPANDFHRLDFLPLGQFTPIDGLTQAHDQLHAACAELGNKGLDVGNHTVLQHRHKFSPVGEPGAQGLNVLGQLGELLLFLAQLGAARADFAQSECQGVKRVWVV